MTQIKDFKRKRIKSIDDLINLLVELQLWEKNQEIELTLESKLIYELNKDQGSTLINCLRNPSPPDNGIKELSELHKLIINLQEKLDKLEEKIEKPTELINPLLPLIAELLRLKATESQELLFEAIIPIMPQIIEQSSQENIEQISDAIAPLLPFAIAKQMKQSPQQIGKAIAPEMALAIQQQMLLDKYSIAKVLGPQIGEAIKNQIKYDRDAMVDALYPVIGSTIMKYMTDLVQSINDKLEKAFTFEGIRRKIRAKSQGISEAELILKETIGCHVQAIFLINKASGLVIAEVQNPLTKRLDADMLAGMLTAIRSFANDCFTVSGKVSELQEIDYDNSKIILEIAGYCYLAVIIQGNTSQLFVEKLKKTMSNIILNYGDLIASFEGDQSTIPETIKLQLEKLLESEAKVKKSKPPLALLLLLLAFVSPLGIIWYRHQVANSGANSKLNTIEYVSLNKRIKPLAEINLETFN